MKEESKKINYNPAENPKTATDQAFRISLYLKGLDGLGETLSGIFLLLVRPAQINHFTHWLTRSELARNPHAFIGTHILHWSNGLTHGSLIFGAAYLLSHGLVKLVLVVEVLRDHLWAYVGLIGVTILFVIYQVYRLVFTKFSFSLLLLTLFDLLIIYLTQKEYRRRTAEANN